MQNKRVLLLGAGNMVSALFSPLGKEGKDSLDIDFYVYTPSGTKADTLSKTLGGHWVKNLKDLTNLEGAFDCIFLGFKPQSYESAVTAFKDSIGDSKVINSSLVVSMLAGTPIEVLKKSFPQNDIARIMPNTPSLIGKGITLILSEKRHGFLEKMLAQSSVLFNCDDQDQFDAMTAVTGSGPAYVFEFSRILAKFLEEKGANSTQSKELVSQLFLGSSLMMKNSEDSIEVLRENVTSPKGVTFEALETFKEGKLEGLTVKALENNFKRSLELREASLKIGKIDV